MLPVARGSAEIKIPFHTNPSGHPHFPVDANPLTHPCSSPNCRIPAGVAALHSPRAPQAIPQLGIHEFASTNAGASTQCHRGANNFRKRESSRNINRNKRARRHQWQARYVFYIENAGRRGGRAQQTVGPTIPIGNLGDLGALAAQRRHRIAQRVSAG